MWAAIKKALNSTLGTSKFKPLDELIMAGKTTVASDAPYMDLVGVVEFATDGAKDYTVPLKIVAKNNGSLRLVANLWSGTTYPKKVFVEINGVVVETFQKNGSSEIEIVGDFSYLAGDEITFACEYQTTQLTAWRINSIKLTGTVVDTSMFDVEEV